MFNYVYISIWILFIFFFGKAIVRWMVFFPLSLAISALMLFYLVKFRHCKIVGHYLIGAPNWFYSWNNFMFTIDEFLG